ncbi:hypothetical protein AC1031_002511 [Aphanomyces cochlioides]|nr:hypothetical protein AC1031_002511 [Aphanomyces cochlioides]
MEESAPKNLKASRWGKWTPEEEAYTNRLISDFSAGILPDVDNGTTMRSWLSTKLRCCPMRISKKFVGEQSIGKRMYERNDARLNDMDPHEKARRAAELNALYLAFCESWAREEREREEQRASGSRKRKRNRKKNAAAAAAKKHQMHTPTLQAAPPSKKPTTLRVSTTSSNVLMMQERRPMTPPAKTIHQPAKVAPTTKSAPLPRNTLSKALEDPFAKTDFFELSTRDIEALSLLNDDSTWMLPLGEYDPLDEFDKVDGVLSSPTSAMELDAVWSAACVDPLHDFVGSPSYILYDPFLDHSC